MKRIACLMLLTALGSPAFAREFFSFTVRGHRIHIEASRHCRSLSCVSISVPGVGNWRRDRRDDDDVASANDQAPSPAAQPASPPSVAPVQTRPVYTPPPAQVAPAPAAAPPAQIATRMQVIAPHISPQPAPVQPAPPPVQAQPLPAPTLAAASSTRVAPPQVATTSQASHADEKADVRPQHNVEDRPGAEQSAPRLSANVARVAEQGEHDAPTPIGDWQTEGAGGLVRIEACGPALCGYVLNASTRAKGETVLVNMKPKKDMRWAGNVYSRSSGNSYYGTMTLRDGDTLRVEACALGSFFCSGNTWTRIEEGRSLRPDVATRPHQPQNPRS